MVLNLVLGENSVAVLDVRRTYNTATLFSPRTRLRDAAACDTITTESWLDVANADTGRRDAMSSTVIIQGVVTLLRKKYGRGESFGKSRLLQFGSLLTCSINYSRMLGGHKYFFGLARDVLDPSYALPETQLGHFVLLVCGSEGNVLVLPRKLVLQMMSNVSTRRLDVFVEDASYILQTTRHPRLTVTEYLNAYPTGGPPDTDPREEAVGNESPDRAHVKVQWQLIQFGRAEGCSVWVPVNDRNLSYRGQPFARDTLGRLPNFGFDESTRRIVQNIDVLWLAGNVIAKAYEIESTTMIYSGLLRLNDLVLSQPNVQIGLHLVAGQSRRGKVYSQLTRPTFRTLLPICQFVTFEFLDGQAKRLEGFPLDEGARISGLIRGERFETSDSYSFPTSV